MTTVYVRLALDRTPVAQTLEIVLKGKEPHDNVIRLLKTLQQEIVQEAVLDEQELLYRIIVNKS
ncbi:sulfurtransferase TusA family protein [Swaminathania salitolerans]|nr:sulfurtransferase TusA family protein [Swaminathania salitolerans]